jgi:hypothetical protein
VAETTSFFKVRLQERVQEAERQTEIERREALARFGIIVEEEDIPPISVSEQSSSEAVQESAIERNGSSALPGSQLSRRQMIVKVVPDFHGRAFSQSDVRGKILERWPHAAARSLASGIANLLREMADNGYLERLEGDPVKYREKQNREDDLLSP